MVNYKINILFQIFERWVVGQIESVETSVRSGIWGFYSEVLILNCEELSPSSVALKGRKSTNGESGCPSAELEKLAELFLAVGLQTVPEPLYDLVGFVVVPSVLGVLPPVFEVNMRVATQ